MSLMHRGISIKRCAPGDIPFLRPLATKTFIDTYAQHNSPEVITDYLNKAFSEDRLRKELSNPDSEFYALILGEKWIGYLKLNQGAAQTDWRKDNVLEVERIYVDKDFQGRGLGKRLLEQALSVAHSKSKQGLWLGVWEHNPSAISFYESQGFVKTGTHPFMMGGEKQNDWVMEKAL